MAKYASEDARNNTAMANVLQQRDELEERNAMLSTSLDEMRMAANRMAEELARALRGAHAERQQLEQLRKEAEAALEAERRAKEELSARQIKDADAPAKMIRRMLDEQRSKLQRERHVIQKELLKEIDELRAKLELAQARPPPVAVPAAGPPPLIPYDKTKTVAQLLKEYLSSKNMRVMDLFRDFDAVVKAHNVHIFHAGICAVVVRWQHDAEAARVRRLADLLSLHLIAIDQHFGGTTARSVIRCHGHAICTR
jgi:small-conductance mechanosensitive channel